MTVADPTTEVRSTFQQSPVTARPRIGVVLHHGATTSADQIIQMETSGSRQVSSNRVVKDGRCVKVANDPAFRAWSLSSAYWDSVLNSVECANESTNGWTVSDASHETLAKMVAFWAQRDGFRPHRDGGPNAPLAVKKTWTVLGHRELYSIHGASYATACPGGMDLDRITARANEILGGAVSPQNIKKRRKHMYLVWDTDGKGYLVTENGTLPLPSPEVYNLFFRVINSEQLLTPFGSPFVAGGLPGKPQVFNAAEMGIIAANLRLIAVSAQTGVTVDYDKLSAALKDAGIDVKATVDAGQLAAAFDAAVPRVAAAIVKQAGQKLAQ
jgi:hypothetical protein